MSAPTPIVASKATRARLRQTVAAALADRGCAADSVLLDQGVAVLVKAEQVWEPDVALIWLHSGNIALAGALPIDVLALRGASEVLDELDATLTGAY